MGGALSAEACTGRVAVITGGGSGIGAAAALKCAQELQMKVRTAVWHCHTLLRWPALWFLDSFYG